MGVNIISSDDFIALISRRSELLLQASRFLKQRQSCNQPLTRPLLGVLLSQATQLEELLDAYGAKNNSQWHFFRALVAAIKLFSNVSYELLHIQHALPVYRLLKHEEEFAHDTKHGLKFTNEVLLRCTSHIIDQATTLGVELPPEIEMDEIYCETLPPGRLAQDLTTRKSETVPITVTLLATAFTNLAEDSRDVLPCQCESPEKCSSYGICQTSEECLRSLELKFHNLQSLYDTYVSKTEIEVEDTSLPILRGHISVVFHLVRIATEFAHYYERHVINQQNGSSVPSQPLVNKDTLLFMLTNYSITYASRFLNCAEQLCKDMLERYVEFDKIEVNVPPYRGFHVRPSSLVAQIVMHYGCNVTMLLEDKPYNASNAMELFTANEKINAMKRKALGKEIFEQKLVPESFDGQDIETALREIFKDLEERSMIMIYEKPLQMQTLNLDENASTLELVKKAIATLLFTCQIDIITDLKVTFIGDIRALKDIKLLAESGYGEDNLGNDIPLVKELKYLRQKQNSRQ